jgi:hypothetical protein
MVLPTVAGRSSGRSVPAEGLAELSAGKSPVDGAPMPE